MPAADPARPLARRAALPPAPCRYGVLPGYGIAFQSGFQDTFTATATAALEVGAFPYAAGVIDNWLAYYARDNGMVTYRAEELAQSGRMLTIFALYHSYTGDHALLLKHYGKVCCAPLPPPPPPAHRVESGRGPSEPASVPRRPRRGESPPALRAPGQGDGGVAALPV